ncbi:lipid II:glycine glycyltransferase FemX [Maricaulis sp. CAU 1757]
MHLETAIDRATWDAALQDRVASLQQDWAYGQAIAGLGAGVSRVGIYINNQLVGLAQFTHRRMVGLVSVAVCTRGPVWLGDIDRKRKAEIHAALKRELGLARPRAILVSPDEEDAHGVERLTRVMTGYSTVLIDLQQEEDELRRRLDGKWRNQLASAERSSLSVQRNGSKPAQYRWLLQTEDGQRVSKGYQATPTELIPAFVEAKNERDSLLILRADEGREKVAAMLFLVHGAAATYHLGWNSAAGRKSGAHNLLLWHAMKALKERGVKSLDLGGVNTAHGAGIARFKLATGGRVVTLAGTYM